MLWEPYHNGLFSPLLVLEISLPEGRSLSVLSEQYKTSYLLYLSLIGIILRWGFLIWELIFIYCRLFCPHLGSFCVVSSFTTFRPNFTSGLLQVILPRPRIAMMSLVTVFPVITAFHSCCPIAPRFFWPSKPLAGLGRIWNRYLLTMLTWNHRDSVPLSAAPRAPKVQGIKALSLYSSRWALSEDNGFKSYPSWPEVYLVKKNVVQ